MKTNVIQYLENYIEKNKIDEKGIINGNILETPAFIGYFEAKDILNLNRRIDKAIEYIENNDIQDDVIDGYDLGAYLETKKLLSILKGENNE